MHPIPPMLDPTGEPIHGRVPPPCVKIGGPEFMVWSIGGNGEALRWNLMFQRLKLMRSRSTCNKGSQP